MSARALPLLMALAATVGCNRTRKGNPEGAPARKVVNPDDPDACAECHGQIVAEWKGSMHARSHHERDPIYGGLHRLVGEKLGEETSKDCALCHNPRDPENPSSPAGKLGVSCATCHMLDEVHVGEGKAGSDALVFASEVRMRAGHDMAPGSSPAHKTGEAPSFIEDRKTLCLACHDAATNPGGVSTCATGAEFASHGKAEQGCMDCHMPRLDGPGGEAGSRSEHASHVFLGPHRAWYHDDASFLATAVSMRGAIDGDELEVSLTNASGHGFPTGFPGRMVVLMVTGTDANRDLIWKNIDEDPMKESPQSVFNKVYVDDAGAPTMPVFAAAMSRDNRLKPEEVRVLKYPLPEAVTTVQLKLVMHLVPPPAHEKLGIAGKLEAEPRVLMTTTVSR